MMNRELMLFCLANLLIWVGYIITFMVTSMQVLSRYAVHISGMHILVLFIGLFLIAIGVFIGIAILPNIER